MHFQGWVGLENSGWRFGTEFLVFFFGERLL
jgi:hypothetical protein